MNILHMPQTIREQVIPFVAFFDLQKEYVAEGRDRYIAGAEDAVANSILLLRRSRELRLPVGHFRLTQKGQFFNKASKFSHWIEAVKPRPNEYVYDHSSPSCFSNAAFCELMENVTTPEIIFAGLSGERTCLSSAIDGFHRGIQMTFVGDCSASTTIGSWTEKTAHDAVQSLISCYGRVKTLDQVLLRYEQLELQKTGS